MAKRRDFGKYSKYALIFATILAFCGVVSFFVILFTESSGRPGVSSAAFSEFFKLFNGPLSFLAASFAVFASWLTLERIAQTERQLDLIGENNKFNNYFKHIEEFAKQFRDDPLMQRWSSITGRDPQKVLLFLYRDFYYRHPVSFAPSINDEAKKLIDQFFKSLKASSLDGDGFEIHKCRKDELLSLTQSLGGQLRQTITTITSKESKSVLARLQERGGPDSERQDLRTKFFHLNEIYWSSMFFSSLLAFDGAEQPNLEQFHSNYTIARSALGI